MASRGIDPSHDPALDGLRGLAIMLVLAMHTVHFEPVRRGWAWLNGVVEAGWIGVDLFFVLSGFLITRVLLQLRAAPNRLGVFYGRRAVRILPGYFVTLAVGVPLILVLAAPPVAALMRESLPWFLVFGQNFHGAMQPPGEVLLPLAHLWSLAVEEQFYLLWPLLVWRLPTSSLPRLALAMAGIAIVCKLLLAIAGVAPHVPYVLPFTRMDGFAAGAWLAARQALGAEGLPRPLQLLPWLAALLLIGVLSSGGSGWPETIWQMVLCISLTPLIFAGVLHAALAAPAASVTRRGLSSATLRFFGRHSYALYLVHPAAVMLQKSLMPWMQTAVPGNLGRLLLMVLAWLVAAALALAMDRLVDAPARRLRRFLEPERGPAAMTGGARA